MADSRVRILAKNRYFWCMFTLPGALDMRKKITRRTFSQAYIPDKMILFSDFIYKKEMRYVIAVKLAAELRTYYEILCMSIFIYHYCRHGHY